MLVAVADCRESPEALAAQHPLLNAEVDSVDVALQRVVFGKGLGAVHALVLALFLTSIRPTITSTSTTTATISIIISNIIVTGCCRPVCCGCTSISSRGTAGAVAGTCCRDKVLSRSSRAWPSVALLAARAALLLVLGVSHICQRSSAGRRCCESRVHHLHATDVCGAAGERAAAAAAAGNGWKRLLWWLLQAAVEVMPANHVQTTTIPISIVIVIFKVVIVVILLIFIIKLVVLVGTQRKVTPLPSHCSRRRRCCRGGHSLRVLPLVKLQQLLVLWQKLFSNKAKHFLLLLAVLLTLLLALLLELSLVEGVRHVCGRRLHGGRGCGCGCGCGCGRRWG